MDEPGFLKPQPHLGRQLIQAIYKRAFGHMDWMRQWGGLLIGLWTDFIHYEVRKIHCDSFIIGGTCKYPHPT